jgi:hypothetical protein
MLTPSGLQEPSFSGKAKIMADLGIEAGREV